MTPTLHGTASNLPHQSRPCGTYYGGILHYSSDVATSRLTGVDVARGLALIGMFATHVMPLVDMSGSEKTPTWVAYLFAGKSAALFATLAGVGLALLTARAWKAHNSKGAGRSSATRTSASTAPTSLGAARKSIAVRALSIMVLGFLAGEFSSGIAVILVHYGVLFLMALLLIQCSIKQLLWLGSGWLLFSPIALFFARAWAYDNVAPYRTSGPVLMDLFRPETLLADLFATGYYPLIVWPTYLIAGLAVGRLLHENPGSWRLPWRLVRLGFAMTFVAYLASWTIVNRNWAHVAEAAEVRRQDLQSALVSGQGLNSLEFTPWWFISSAPHAGTQLDLLLTLGTSLLVLSLCLILCRSLETGLKQVGDALLWPLAGAGTTTLTLYVGHIVALDVFSTGFASLEPIHRWILLVVIALLFGVFVKAKQVRGPLEWMIHSLATLASGQDTGSKTRRG